MNYGIWLDSNKWVHVQQDKVNVINSQNFFAMGSCRISKPILDSAILKDRNIRLSV